MVNKVTDCYRIALESLELFSLYLESQEIESATFRELCDSLYSITEGLDAEKAMFIHLLDKTLTDSEKLYQKAKHVLNKAIEVEDRSMAKVTAQFVSVVYNENVCKELCK